MFTLFKRLPFCCHPGAVIGALCGLAFEALLIRMAPLSMTPLQAIQAGVLLGALGFLFCLFLFMVLLRYRWSSLGWPLLVNAIVVGVASVELNLLINWPVFAALIGALAGILLGALLCPLCSLLATNGARK
jgi:hypothetical protein